MHFQQLTRGDQAIRLWQFALCHVWGQAQYLLSGLRLPAGGQGIGAVHFLSCPQNRILAGRPVLNSALASEQAYSTTNASPMRLCLNALFFIVVVRDKDSAAQDRAGGPSNQSSEAGQMRQREIG